MVRVLALIALLIMASASQAFTIAPRATSFTTAMQSPTVLFGLLTEQESSEIMAKSLECADGECSIEDVDCLLKDLKEQQKVLTGRLEEVTQMISSLDGVNKDDERKVDEVRETVRAIARLFLMGDKGSGKPTGWTGDVGKGATTAYDALPPKKWKNPSP
jgi:hypothetical protein